MLEQRPAPRGILAEARQQLWQKCHTRVQVSDGGIGHMMVECFPTLIFHDSTGGWGGGEEHLYQALPENPFLTQSNTEFSLHYPRSVLTGKL